MKKSFWRIGFSGAASWAWGTSLIMGQQIAQEKGLIAWVIWAVCNSLTLALLGWLYNKNIITPEVYNRKEVKVIALVIQLFCLLVQLNFINQQFIKILNNPTAAYLITMAIGFVFTLMVFKKGLPMSVNTDIIQWILAIISIVIIVIVGMTTKVSHQIFAQTSSSGILWGIWSGLILFAGPIGDVQHWQRVSADTSKRAYYLSAGLFAMYMGLILWMAYFEFSRVMNIILLITVLCITTSTIDSIAVATHEIKNKKIGTFVSLFMCVVWGLFVRIGMIDLWSSFGVIRFAFAVGILILPACLEGKIKVTIPILSVTCAIMIVFAVLGQITINNIAGIISFAIAMLIVIFLMLKSVAVNMNNQKVKKTIYNKE